MRFLDRLPILGKVCRVGSEGGSAGLEVRYARSALISSVLSLSNTEGTFAARTKNYIRLRSANFVDRCIYRTPRDKYG